MILTIDASIAVKWIVDEPGSDAARQFLPTVDAGTAIGNLLIAPAIIELELHNTLAKLYRDKRISVGQLAGGRDEVEYWVRIDAIERELIRRAYDFSMGAANQLARWAGRPPLPGMPAPFNIYDCIYVAHARLHGAKLVTADRKQADVATAFGIPVELIQTT